MFLNPTFLIECSRQEQIALIVDRVVSEADKDNDGFINFEEFKDAINKLNVEEKMAFIGFKWT